MDAESLLGRLVERRRDEFRRLPPESRSDHAHFRATPFLLGARQALVGIGAVSEERADAILRPWYDDMHAAGLLEYGEEGKATIGFAMGEAKPEDPPL